MNTKVTDIRDAKPFDWIQIGPKSDRTRFAVVIKVFEEPDEILGDAHAVYLDEANRAIHDHFVWKDNQWHFLHKGPSGGYADHKAYFQPFVDQLRRGRYRTS